MFIAMDKKLTVRIDMPAPDLLTFELVDGSGSVIASQTCAYERPVDNLLLTTVDNLLNRSRLDRLALNDVVLGEGIDKNSSLYRIVQSFAAAIAAAQ